MALPLTGITTSMVAAAIGEASNDVGALCTSNKINKWSKRKPIANSAIKLTGEKYWRGDGYLDNIRNGFHISSENVDSNYSNAIWEYIYGKWSVNDYFRLGDFRGYEHSASMMNFHITVPTAFSIYEPYIVEIVIDGYISTDSVNETGGMGLQDVFKLDSKYCSFGCKIKNLSNNQTITKYSPQLEYTDFDDDPRVELYGAQLSFSVAELEDIISGGEIMVEVFLSEADNSSKLNEKRYSLRGNANVITKILNTQFLGTGITFDTNWEAQSVKLVGSSIKNEGNLWVSFNTNGKQAGSTSQNLCFSASILNGNQLGESYKYYLPVISYSSNNSYQWSIPASDSGLDGEFELNVLNPQLPITMRVKITDGDPDNPNSNILDYYDFVLQS